MVIQAANDAGIPTTDGWDPTSRIALGNPMVSPLSAAAGFATLANGGVRNSPHIVSEVLDANGTVVYKAAPENSGDRGLGCAGRHLRAHQRDHLRNRRSVLALAPGGGQDRYEVRQRQKRTVASWFVGYTKQVSTAVMFVAGTPAWRTRRLFLRLLRIQPSARTWLATMRVTMAGKDHLGSTARPATSRPVVDHPPKPKPEKSDKDKSKPKPEGDQVPGDHGTDRRADSG